MPSPSYAAPQTASPGTAATDGADVADPVEVADGVLRQRAAPPLHVRVDRPDATARSRRRGPPGRARRAPRRSRWSTCSSRCRPIEQRITQHAVGARRPARTQSHLAKEYVAAFTDRLSTGGTRKPEPCGRREVAGAEGQRDDRHRRVLDPGQLQGRVGHHVGEQPAGRRAPGWRGRPRRRAAPRGRGSEPTTRFQPPSAARARSRTVASVRTSSPARGHDGGGQPADARRPGPANTGYVGGRPAGRGGGGPHHRPVPVEQRDHLGHGGPRRDLAGVAGVDAAEQRLDEPVDDLAAEALLDQPADADVLAVEAGRRAAPRPGRPGPARTWR